MDREKVDNLFLQFLKNGMNISEFKFRDENDKRNLFIVYEEYLKSMMPDSDKDIFIYPNIEQDITVFVGTKQVCVFEIDPDYVTLMCHTTLDLDDEDLIYCLSMFFLTIKELKSMMSALTKGFSKLASKSENSSNRKYHTLPSNAQVVVNRIQEIQDAIMKNINKKNKKYTITKGDK